MDVDELHALCGRLVLDADEDRRTLERRLHAGIQQELVALAIKLQLVAPLVDSDPVAAKALLEEIAQDVQQAVGEATELAERLFAPLAEAADLAAALRGAAGRAQIPATVDVETTASYPPEAARTIHLCWLETLDTVGPDPRAAITVRAESAAIAFDVVATGDIPATGFERLHNRVEALGGRLTIQPEPDGGTRISGTLPAPDAAATESRPGRGSPP